MRIVSVHSFSTRVWYVLALIICAAWTFTTGISAEGVSVASDLGTARPGDEVVGTRSVQLYVSATGPYQILAGVPEAFHDAVRADRTIPVERLRWRVHDSGESWMTPQAGTFTTIVAREHATPPGGEVIGIDYMFAPTWDDPPSIGGYHLDVTYEVRGEAVVYASTASPNPTRPGEKVLLTCWRTEAVSEQFSATVESHDGTVLMHESWFESDAAKKIDFAWDGILVDNSILLPGEYTYTLYGSITGRCGTGILVVVPAHHQPLMSIATEPSITDSNPLAVGVTLTGTGRVGEWLTLTIDVRNDGISTANDVALIVSLPEGLEPIGTVSEYKVTALPPLNTWTQQIDLLVSPRSAPGTIEVRAEVVDADRNVIVGTATAQFIPESDDWLRPNSVFSFAGKAERKILIDNFSGHPLTVDSKTSLPQGWHVLWATDSLGRLARPTLFDVPSAAPHRYEISDVFFPAQQGGLVTGYSSVDFSSYDWNLNLAGEGWANIGDWKVESRLTDETRGDTRPLGLRITHTRGIFAELTGQPTTGERTKEQLTIGWTSTRRQDSDGRIRLSQTIRPDGPPTTHVAWDKTSAQGGLRVSHAFIPGERNAIDIGIWRKQQGAFPGVRVDSKTDGGDGRVRIGLTHGIATRWGNIRAGGSLRIDSDRDSQSSLAGHIGWFTRSPSWNIQPFGRISWSVRDVTTDVGWHTVSDSGMSRIVLGRSMRRNTVHFRWHRRRQLGEGAVELKVAADRSRFSSSVELIDIDHRGWKIDGAMSAQYDHDQVEHSVHIVARGDMTAWQARVKRTKDTTVTQNEMRLDMARTFSIVGMQGRGGFLGGLRNTTDNGRIEDQRTRLTTVSFVGGWGELKWFPSLWGGVSVAKWNRERGHEYDVYLRYELTPQLWIKAGHHVAPGSLGLFNETSSGPYVRAMWAFQSAW